MAGFCGRLIPEVKSLGDDGTFEGVLSTYGNVDLVGDIVEPGAFSKCLSERGSTYQLLRDHEWGKIIGLYDVVDDRDALRIKGRICLDTQDGRDTWALIRFGALDGLSIGYYATKYHYDQDGVRHLDELELREGSVVGDPANPMARIQAKSRRLARMSRYARCRFLTKMTPEERDEALAELDAVDSEVEDTSEDKTAEEGSEEETEDKEGEDPDTEGEEESKETEDEDEPEEKEEESETMLDALRQVRKACDDLVGRLEG